MQKEKTILFIFSNRKLESQKDQIFLYFFQKQRYAMQSRLKPIYMHIKQIYVFVFFFYKMQKKK